MNTIAVAPDDIFTGPLLLVIRPEEYIDYVKDFEYQKNHPYFGQAVFFGDADRAVAGLELPEEGTHISGNNVDGFIVTIWRRD